MKTPILEKHPQARRNLLFAPITLGIAFVGFLLVGLLTNVFLLALFLGPALGVAGAWALVGFPRRVKQPEKPLVDARVRPWLFFPLFIVVTGGLYVVLGVVLTPLLPGGLLDLLAYVALGLALATAAPSVYLLVGFPDLTKGAKDAWARIPANRRPWLFFPLAALFAGLSYFLVGLGLTQTAVPLDIQPLIVLPVALALGGAGAYLIVGFPRPETPLKERIPDVPAQSRPVALAITWVLLGVPLAVLAGALLESRAPLSPTVSLVLSLFLGYALALGVAVLAWGHPGRWRRMEGYEPGVSDGVRRALFLPVLLLSVAAGAAGFGLLGVDVFLGGLLGLVVGVPLALAASGLGRRLLSLKGGGLHWPEVPDMLKPLVLLSVTVALAAVVFVLATYAFPGLVGWNLALALVVGLAAGILATERDLFRDFKEERRRERERRAALERVREQRLRAATEKPVAAAGGAPDEKDGG